MSATVESWGKVLIAGGYLILDHRNRGIALKFPASMRCTFTLQSRSPSQTPKTICQVQITNLKFPLQSSVLEISFFPHPSIFSDFTIYNKSTGVVLSPSSYNFLEYSLLVPLLMFDITEDVEIGLLIDSDSAFYSSIHNTQPLQQLQASEAAKTGLGSSACFIDCVLGSMAKGLACSKFSCVLDLPLACTIHAMCQLANFMAQKKQGSGYDVTAGIYGSLIYRRPNIELAPLVDKLLLSDVIQAVSPAFSNAFEPLQLAAGLQVIMIEHSFSKGTKTVGAVASVRHWLAEYDTDGKIWLKWGQLGERFILDFLGCFNVQDRRSDVDLWSSASYCRASYVELRTHVRHISDLSGIPIDPPEVRSLVDHVHDMPGVLLAGIPGAGGFDAIFALISSASFKNIEHFTNKLSAHFSTIDAHSTVHFKVIQ